MIKKMAESQGKRLLIDFSEYFKPDFKSITYLACSKKAETLYLVHQNSEGEEECYELATSGEELTNIRDLLIDVVSKIEKNYGLEQSVKIIKRD
ncbi:hypothetical protein ES702_03510 [subsurface metagenome]